MKQCQGRGMGPKDNSQVLSSTRLGFESRYPPTHSVTSVVLPLLWVPHYLIYTMGIIYYYSYILHIRACIIYCIITEYCQGSTEIG